MAVFRKIAPDLSGHDPNTEVFFDQDAFSEVNVMPGWVDPHVEGGEPGFEARDIESLSLSQSAAYRGFYVGFNA